MYSRFVRTAMCFGPSLGLFGCGADNPAAPVTPTITGLNAQLNPYNNLSSVITFIADHADSARVIYWSSGQSPDTTPFRPVSSGTDTVFTLGMKATTNYYYQVELVGPKGTTESDTLLLASGSLPEPLQEARLAITGTAGPGYTLTALYGGTSAFLVAFDRSGEIRWYRGFDEGVGPVEAKQQPSGNFTLFLGRSFGFNPTYGRFVEFLPNGVTVQNHFAGQPYYTNPHELLLTPNEGAGENAHLFGYDIRNLDLSSFGGPASALVAGHALLRHSANGEPDFIWSAWDHFSLDDCVNPPPAFIGNLDFDHPNSLAFDRDGNYIASFYRFNAVVKIDARSGDILWQLGGVKNQFTILNDPLGGFGAQHDARILDNGNLLLYDNGHYHSPPESRAAEYALDPVNMTATLVWEYRHTPGIFTPILGSAQRLLNGNTFVGFTQAGKVAEVAPNGAVVWEGDIQVAGVAYAAYRAIRIASLYKYQRP